MQSSRTNQITPKEVKSTETTSKIIKWHKSKLKVWALPVCGLIGDDVWDWWWWWWWRLSWSSLWDTLLSSLSTNWTNTRWSCLKLESGNRTCNHTVWTNTVNNICTSITLRFRCSVNSVYMHRLCCWYLCSSRLTWSPFSWLASLSLLSLCTWVLKTSSRRASLRKSRPRWPMI